MHVLLTNDDGPPSDTYSPYFHYLVQAIHKYTDWHVTVVLPDTQRSWIGKAHMIGQTITASYIEAPEEIGGDVKGPFKRPPKDADPKRVWTLLNGTPATCTNIGLNYMVDETKGPVDLVISGPNFGRNTTALYSTTSGTIGAAMEGALCGSKGVALSYAYYSRDLVPEIVAEASRLAVRLIAKLYANWDQGVDLYSVNVPLIKELSDETKAFHAPILQNRWKGTFEPWEKAIVHDQSEADGNIPIDTEDEHVCDSDHLTDAEKAKEGYTMFRWAPDFEAVGKSVKASSPGNDGWVVDQGHISVTGLKASFAETGITGEIALSEKESVNGFLLTIPPSAYLHPLFSQSVKKHLPDVPVGSKGKEKTFHYGEYEDLDFDKLGARDKSYFGCSYIYRKALIRKHYLANTIAMFRAKNPDSVLNQSFPDTFNLELDYAEFLDESLDEAYELRQELEKNDELEAAERKLWILKPSMSDKAQGIRLFSTIDELQAIFDSFEEGYDSDEEQEEEDDDNGVITSQLRHFIVQEYVDKPLILSGHGNKKFHIRTYVLAVGDISVYVYKHMLALFAPREYATTDEVHDLSRHLTNTCLRDDDTILKESLVEEFWNLKGLEQSQKEAVFAKICDNVKDIFLAATTVDKINFQPLANSMEFFGLDFLVDENLNVHILEVNSYPDFKQTGNDLKYVVEGLIDETVQVAVKPWFEGGDAPESELLKRVL